MFNFKSKSPRAEDQTNPTFSDVDDAFSEDSYLDPKLEWRFVRKLDFILVTWAFFAYLMKMIDGTNYKTAYASGMKEEMKMTGNELNYLDITFRIGYAIFLLPCQVVLTKTRPNWFLPSMEMAWGVMTALMAAAKDVRMMYALRFMIGVFEASSYPGIISILCNWYTPREVSARIIIFSASYPASAMFVSAMQASLSKTLDGHSGLSGWRWLFIFNAIMTFIVAGAGYFMVPDAPGTTKIFWMSERDNKIARARMDRVERLPSTRYSWGLVKGIFKNPFTYIFVLAYGFWSFSQDSNGWFILFLKSVVKADGTKRFNVAEINAISIPAYALMLVAMLIFAYLHSVTGWHTVWVLVQQGIVIVGLIILIIWPQSFAVKMVGFFLLFCATAAGPILVGWMSQHFHTPEERSIVIGLAVTFVFAMSAWMSIVFYPAKFAPKYPIGYKAAIAFALVSVALTLVFRWLSLRRPGTTRTAIEEEDDQVLQHESTEETKTGDGLVKGELAGIPTLRA